MGDARKSSIIEVSQIIKIIPTGVTMPILCRLRNGDIAVVKYWRNRFGVRVLLNEFIGNKIAEEIGLTIPKYGLCHLSKEVIFETDTYGELEADNEGIGVYSKYISATTPVTIGILSEISNHQAELLLLFDYIVNNKDRHKGNLLIDLSNAPRMVSIDNSHILLSSKREKHRALTDRFEAARELSTAIYLENRKIYDKLAFGLGFNNIKLIEEAERIKKVLDEGWIGELFSLIPEEWIVENMCDEIKAMRATISYRVKKLREIVDIIIEERGR